MRCGKNDDNLNLYILDLQLHLLVMGAIERVEVAVRITILFLKTRGSLSALKMIATWKSKPPFTNVRWDGIKRR